MSGSEKVEGDHADKELMKPAKKIYTLACSNCGAELSRLLQTCPRCGCRRQQITGNLQMTVSAGTTVTFPVYSHNPAQAQLELEGEGHVSLAGESRVLEFAEGKKIHRKHGPNWCQIQLRRDKTGLDVIFGRRGGCSHSHYSYEARARTTYARDEGTVLRRQLSFDINDGAVVPIADTIHDRETGMSLNIKFALRNEKVVIGRVRFFPTPTT